MRPKNDDHTWFAIKDEPADTTWLFDISFLLSNYSCIYGKGCSSIAEQPDPTGTLGCCTHGAHISDDEDKKDVTKYTELLTDEDWQFRQLALSRGGPFKEVGEDIITRQTDGACIFLNRSDFPGGAGCALHSAALKHGQRPLDWKPDVCWQVPIRLEIHEDDYEHETVMVRSWDRRDWGPGAEEFHWWCIEENEAYEKSDKYAYQTLREELTEMVGEDIYQQLETHLQTIVDSIKTETRVTLKI